MSPRRSLLLIGLAGCAATPVKLGPDSDPRVARELLANAAATGPVRLGGQRAAVRAGDTTLTQPHVAEQAARGVTNLSVRFDRTARPRRARRGCCCCSIRRRTRPARQVCTASPLPTPVPAPSRCACWRSSATAAPSSPTRPPRPTGTTAADVDRLIWRTVGDLFPDDWPETYGIRSFFGL